MSLNIFLPSSQFVFAPICFNIGPIYISQNIDLSKPLLLTTDYTMWLYIIYVQSSFYKIMGFCVLFSNWIFFSLWLLQRSSYFFLNNAVQIIILKNSRKCNILCITFKIFSYTVVYVFEQVFAYTLPSKSSLIVLLWTNIFQHFVLYRLTFFSRYLIKIQTVESPLNEIVHSL